ncbi:MAG: VWA domain-containing protein [Candidatus Promineifilaceae bacterium]
MSFGQPLYLFGLLLVPLLILFLAWAERRRQLALRKLGDLVLVERLTDTINRRGRRWRQRFWLIGISLVLVAVARPQWGTSTQVVAQEGIQIMVALDISESMLAQDLQPDRLTRAKQTIIELMEQLRGDQVGVALFSGAAFIQFPITSDYGTARAFLLSANPSMISRGGSNLGDAIRTASSGFDTQRSSQKVIIVMTDGESHNRSPVTEARQVAEEGIVIYTIGFGSAEGGPIPQFNEIGQLVGFKSDRNGQIVNTRIEEAVLREIASVTNGEYFRASASGDEIGILADLIAQLESAELESRFEVQAVERFYLFLILALFCFIAAEVIPERQRASAIRFEQLLGVLVMGWVLTGCGGAVTGIQSLDDGNAQYVAAAYEDALNSYTEARASGVESAEPIYNSANVQYRQERFVESAETMQLALDISDPVLSASAYYNLGNTHFAQQDWPVAIEAYKDALRLDPSDVDAKHNLELALRQLQQEQEEEEQQEEETPEPEEEQPEEQGSEDEPEQEQPEESEGDEPASESPTPTPEPSSEDEEDEGDPPPEEEPTPDPEQPEDNSNSENNEDPQEEDPNSDSNVPPPPPPSGELTEEQALQLLDAIEQDTETLQEQLNQSYTEPGPPPDKDW